MGWLVKLVVGLHKHLELLVVSVILYSLFRLDVGDQEDGV